MREVVHSPGDSPRVVLVHGFTQTRASWDVVAGRLDTGLVERKLDTLTTTEVPDVVFAAGTGDYAVLSERPDVVAYDIFPTVMLVEAGGSSVVSDIVFNQHIA